MPRLTLPLRLSMLSLASVHLACTLISPAPSATALPIGTLAVLATPGAAASPPPLQTGYEIISDTFVHLAFALPEGWTMVSGTAPGAVYAEYGPPSPGTYPTFRAGADAELGTTTSPEDVLSSMMPLIASQAGNNLAIIDEHDTTIAEQHAGVMEYSLTRSPQEAYFSIIAVTIGPDGRGYILQWTASSAAEAEVRDLLNNMLPFFQFLP